MENGKKLFKSVYDENPIKFKEDFNKGVAEKIKDKIEAKKQEIIDSINSAESETETEE